MRLRSDHLRSYVAFEACVPSLLTVIMTRLFFPKKYTPSLYHTKGDLHVVVYFVRFLSAKLAALPAARTNTRAARMTRWKPHAITSSAEP